MRQEFADTIVRLIVTIICLVKKYNFHNLCNFLLQEKIKRLDSEMESSSADNIGEDAVTQVLGKDKPGRIRGMGRGVTVTKLAFLHARDSHVKQLEATQAELINKVQDLQNVVKDLAGKKVNSLFFLLNYSNFCYL